MKKRFLFFVLFRVINIFQWNGNVPITACCYFFVGIESISKADEISSIFTLIAIGPRKIEADGEKGGEEEKEKKRLWNLINLLNIEWISSALQVLFDWVLSLSSNWSLSPSIVRLALEALRQQMSRWPFATWPVKKRRTSETFHLSNRNEPNRTVCPTFSQSNGKGSKAKMAFSCLERPTRCEYH